MNNYDDYSIIETANNEMTLRERLDNCISDLLIECKVSPKLQGYRLAKYVLIEFVLSDFRTYQQKTKLYRRVAEERDDEEHHVDRAIRTMLRNINMHNGNGKLNDWLGKVTFVEGVPIVNNDFIDVVGNELRKLFKL